MNESEELRNESLNNDEYKGLSRSQAFKLLFTKSLISEPPCCPECNTVLPQRDLKKCVYCGFHYSYLEKLFPRDLPTLARINDFAKALSNSGLASLNKSLNYIKKRYPQLIVKIAILPLQSDIEIQQMALWMLNECPLPTGEQDQDRLWTVLLLIDTETKSSCFASGYKAEVFWTHEASVDSVTKLNKALRKQTLVEGLESTMESMLINLDFSKKAARKAHRMRYRKFKKQGF